jgi:hypothetical protein
MQPYTDVLFSSTGPVRNVSVTIKTYPGGAVATIYSDNGVTTAANPLTTGNDGRFLFYAADGFYTITVSGAGITTATIGPILLQDYATTTPVASKLAASSGSSLVGTIAAGTGAVAGTVQQELRWIVRLTQFLPTGYVTDGSVDYSTQLQACLTYAVSLQSAGLNGGSGGCDIIVPRGIWKFSTGLTIVPTSGLISVSLVGEGRGSTLNYTGVGGTALTIKNNNNYRLANLYINNGGSGTTTGVALQSTTAGSSSTLPLPSNLIIIGFTTGLRIGSTGDLATSEVLVQGINIQTATTGVIIEGASPSTNSISVHFLNVGCLTCTTGFKYSGDTTSKNNLVTFRSTECGSCTTDFDFQSPATVEIDGHHTEGNTAGWKLINTAASANVKPPMMMSVSNINTSQTVVTNSIIAWAGSYSFRNADISGLTVGDSVLGNSYQIDVWGRDIPITYAGGSQSMIFRSRWPSANNMSNNQGIIGLAIDMWDSLGVNTTLLAMPWAYPATPAINVGAPFKSTSATAGIGYGTGAGGAQTQATSKATAVTLSKITGEITTAADALAAATIVSFVLTNTAIAIGDQVLVQHVSGGTVGAYTTTAVAAAGSATIYIRNATAGPLSEALVLKFSVLKAVTA